MPSSAGRQRRRGSGARRRCSRAAAPPARVAIAGQQRAPAPCWRRGPASGAPAHQTPCLPARQAQRAAGPGPCLPAAPPTCRAHRTTCTETEGEWLVSHRASVAEAEHSLRVSNPGCVGAAAGPMSGPTHHPLQAWQAAPVSGGGLAQSSRIACIYASQLSVLADHGPACVSPLPANVWPTNNRLAALLPTCQAGKCSLADPPNKRPPTPLGALTCHSHAWTAPAAAARPGPCPRRRTCCAAPAASRGATGRQRRQTLSAALVMMQRTRPYGAKQSWACACFVPIGRTKQACTHQRSRSRRQRAGLAWRARFLLAGGGSWAVLVGARVASSERSTCSMPCTDSKALTRGQGPGSAGSRVVGLRARGSQNAAASNQVRRGRPG